jgi:enoyl-CoA hydratase/carnithine racemase
MWPNGDQASVQRIGKAGIGKAGMGETVVRVAVDGRSVAQVMLNRPGRGNAYDGELLGQLAAGLEARLAEILDAILLSAPGAITATKHSILAANRFLLDGATMAELAEESRRQRASAEGHEGLAAFREKRRPVW